MESIKKTWQFIPLTRREAADQYMLLTLISFAASVTVTRLFLSLTNYPQVGGGKLHIAHVLWGGLLLYTAALLPLLFANRRIYAMSAILAFISEKYEYKPKDCDSYFN